MNTQFSRLETLFKGIVAGLAGFCLLFLWVVSLGSTSAMVDTETILFIQDNPLLHTAVFALAVLAAVLWQRKRPVLPRWVEPVLLLLVGLLLCWFIHLTQLCPVYDQEHLLECAREVLAGNFDCLNPSGYLGMYAHQRSFMLYLLPMVSLLGEKSDLALQYLNVVWYLLAVVFWSKASGRQSGCSGVLPQLLLLPMGLYVTFVYGTLPGLAMSGVAFYCLARYQEEGHLPWGIGAAAAIALASLLKSNYSIFLVAMVLLLGWQALSQKQFQPLLCIIFALVLLFGGKSLTNWLLYGRNGMKVPDGIPMASYAAMGLHDGGGDTNSGVGGWTDGYNLQFYSGENLDQSDNAQHAMQDAMSSINGWCAHPADALCFFSAKNLSQWDTPTYDSLSINRNRDTADPLAGVRFPALSLLRQGGQLQRLFRQYCNLLQSLIWAGVLLFLFLRFRSTPLLHYGIFLIFLGGFAYHTVCEAKGQYTLPYVFLLMPYAVSGFLALADVLPSSAKCLRKKQRLCAVAAGVLVIFCAFRARALSGDTQRYQEILSQTKPLITEAAYQISCQGLILENENGEVLLGDSPASWVLSYFRYNYTSVKDEYVLNDPSLSVGYLATKGTEDFNLELRCYQSNWQDDSYRWTFQQAENGGWYIRQRRYLNGQSVSLYLTAHPETGTAQLEEFTGAANQIWILDPA